MAATTISKSRSDDPRFQRSLRTLIDSVTGLLDAGPIEEVSITRVVEKAGVTRPTFYQHFVDLPDAARKAGLDRLAAAFPPPEEFCAPDLISAESRRQRIEQDTEPVLRHLREHRAFYLRVLDGAGNVSFFQEIVAFVASRMLSDGFEAAARHGAAAQDDLKAVMAGGVTWLVIAWLRNGAVEEPADMARRLSGIAATLVR